MIIEIGKEVTGHILFWQVCLISFFMRVHNLFHVRYFLEIEKHKMLVAYYNVRCICIFVWACLLVSF